MIVQVTGRRRNSSADRSGPAGRGSPVQDDGRATSMPLRFGSLADRARMTRAAAENGEGPIGLAGQLNSVEDCSESGGAPIWVI